MLGAVAAAPTLLCTYHDWDGHRSARHITKLGRLVDDLVGGHQGEIHEQQFDYRPHPGHRRANAQTYKTGLTDRRVAHALRAKFIDQILGHAKDTAVMSDVFPHKEDARIHPHLLTERFIQSLSISHVWHGAHTP